MGSFAKRMAQLGATRENWRDKYPLHPLAGTDREAAGKQRLEAQQKWEEFKQAVDKDQERFDIPAYQRPPQACTSLQTRCLQVLLYGALMHNLLCRSRTTTPQTQT